MTSKSVGIAILGSGGWGSNHVRVWHELGALHIVCDPDPTRRAEVMAAYPDVDVTDDVDVALRASGVEGVVVAAPAVTHGELALRALEAGKHVLVEKPLATDLGDAEKLVEVADDRGLVLMVGHVLEFHPAVDALKRLVATGALGKLLYLYSNRLNLGKVRTEENALWSFAPHDIALLLRLMGEAPQEVVTTGGAYLSDGVADTTLMSLRFSRGVPAHVFVSWLHPFKEHRFVVVGDRQMAVFDDTAPWEEKLVLYPNTVEWVGGRVPVAGKAEGIPVALEAGEPLGIECLAFLEAIAGGETLTDGRSGLNVLRVIDAAQRSLDQGGQPISVTPTRALGYRAHPTATIDEGARIGTGTQVWHSSHVMGTARIGNDCVLGQNVFVGANVRIGHGVKIQNNVSVYEGVELEDFVFCGPSAVFTNVSHPRSEIDGRDEFRRTRVRRGASIGANATIVPGITIGRYAFVAAGAVVTHDVPDHALVMGVPARVAGWICECGARHDEPLALCAACGRIGDFEAERSEPGL